MWHLNLRGHFGDCSRKEETRVNLSRRPTEGTPIQARVVPERLSTMRTLEARRIRNNSIHGMTISPWPKVWRDFKEVHNKSTVYGDREVETFNVYEIECATAFFVTTSSVRNTFWWCEITHEKLRKEKIFFSRTLRLFNVKWNWAGMNLTNRRQTPVGRCHRRVNLLIFSPGVNYKN